MSKSNGAVARVLDFPTPEKPGRAVKPVTKAVPLDRLLTAAQAGDEWHLGTGERHVRRLIAERRIRFVRIGRLVRVPESAVLEFIEAGTVPAVR